MNNNTDFKNIWLQQKVSKPDIEELHNKLKQYKNSTIRKLIKTNVLLIATSVFMLFIWHYFQPQMITTKIGIILIILGIFVFLSANNQLLPIFKKNDNTQSNIDYLKSLTAIKKKQVFLQTTMLNLYLLMFLIGLCLYMYEYTSKMTLFWAIVTYTIALGWIGFNWFYTRPKTIKKQKGKLNELISKFKDLNNHLNEE